MVYTSLTYKKLLKKLKQLNKKLKFRQNDVRPQLQSGIFFTFFDYKNMDYFDILPKQQTPCYLLSLLYHQQHISLHQILHQAVQQKYLNHLNNPQNISKCALLYLKFL